MIAERNGTLLVHAGPSSRNPMMRLRLLHGCALCTWLIAVIALQLYEEGKLTLHTPIATYLPSCAGELGPTQGPFQMRCSGVWVREDSLAGRKFKTVTRPGQIMGANTVLYRVVQAGLTVIVLSNTDVSNVDALAREVSKAVLE